MQHFKHYTWLDETDFQYIVIIWLKTRFLCPGQQFAVTIHYNDVIMSAMASQITSLTMIY